MRLSTLRKICFSNEMFMQRWADLAFKALHETGLMSCDVNCTIEILKALETDGDCPYSFINPERWEKAKEEAGVKTDLCLTCDLSDKSNPLLVVLIAEDLKKEHEWQFLKLETDKLMKLWTAKAKELLKGREEEDCQEFVDMIVQVGKKTSWKIFKAAYAFNTEKLIEAAEAAVEVHELLKKMEID